jgi:3-polyprenyl-4-hydroxybenzoate decarboxylase
MATPPRLVRATAARVYDLRDTTTVVGPDGIARRLTGDSAHLARAVLSFLAAPRTRDELLAHLGELAGAPLTDARVVDELLALLRGAGALREPAAVPAHTAGSTAGAAPSRAGEAVRVVLGVSGAVWAVNVPALVALLQRRGCDVRVALTPAARRFVAPPALAALTHGAVYTGLFRGDARCPVPHINLAEWADAVLVCPASATTLARIARGDCSELVAAVAIATRAPVLLVPSMNPAMYAAPAVARNLETLREDGFGLLHPTLGVEVAHRPDARAAVFGPAPLPEDVLAAFASLLPARAAPRAPAREDAVAAPPDAPVVTAGPQVWDEVYRTTAPEALPWYAPALEDDVARALERFAPPPGRFLDVGTGTGTTALAAAQRGYTALGTDVSAAALEQAAQRAGSEAVLFLRDDVTATDVRGAFDVVHDRACLHTLPPAQRARYVAAVAGMTRPGGCFVVKTHHPDAAARNTYPFTEADLAALFAPWFELLHAEQTTLAGAGGAKPAVLAVFRRRP